MRGEGERHAKAVRARYDSHRSRIVVTLDNGLELAFPPRMAEGLGQATRAELAEIEISPSGEGLHWRAVDADLYIPSLLRGVFGSRFGWRGDSELPEARRVRAPRPTPRSGMAEKAEDLRRSRGRSEHGALSESVGAEWDPMRPAPSLLI